MADPSMSSASFQGPAESSYAAAWGIGSIVLGLVLPIGVPIGSIAAGTGFTAYASLGGKLDPNDVRDLFTTLVVIWVALLPVPFCGLWFGIRGLLWAGRTRASCALPLTGLLLCMMDLVLLIITLIVVLVLQANIAGKR